MEDVLLFVVAPAGLFALIALVTLVRPSGRGSRWRSGDAWDHEPLWWMANPRGSGVAGPDDPAADTEGPDGGRSHTARGGARGTW